MIRTVTPLPNEIAHGHLGRLMRLNDARTIASLFVNTALTERRPVIARAAILCGLAPEQYVALHTLVPYVRFITGDRNPPQFGAVESDPSTQKVALATQKKGWSICPSCVEEDMEFWGFSYWRRDHQLPGLFACAKHGVALLVSDETNTNPMFVTPREAMTYAKPCPHGERLMQVLQHPKVKIFYDLQQVLLERQRPFALTAVRRTLAKFAKSSNLRISPCGIREAFGDRVLGAFPPEWATYAYGTECATREVFVKRLTVTTQTTTPCVTALYLLCLAAAYDAADDAISAVEEMQILPMPDTRVSRNFTLQDWHSVEGRELYRSCGGSHDAVARALELCKRSTKKWLHLAGLPAFDKGPKGDPLRSAFAAFASGDSIGRVCELHHVRPAELEAALRAAAQGAVHALGLGGKRLRKPPNRPKQPNNLKMGRSIASRGDFQSAGDAVVTRPA